MFRSAPSMNSRKAKEPRHRTISLPCAERSRRPESGWYSIKRVQREYSAEMPAPICLMLLLHSAASGCRRVGSGFNFNKTRCIACSNTGVLPGRLGRMLRNRFYMSQGAMDYRIDDNGAQKRQRRRAAHSPSCRTTTTHLSMAKPRSSLATG